jgi:hypothetical protein
MEAKIRLDEMKETRRTHPTFAFRGVDELVIIEIDELINKELKSYNNINKKLNKDRKEFNSLIGKEDEISKKRSEELQNIIESGYKKIDEFETEIKRGDIATKIIDQIRTREVKNPDNQVRENLQLVSYDGKELNKVDANKANNFVQMIIEKKFKSNKIRNEFSMKNKSFFGKTLYNSVPISKR